MAKGNFGERLKRERDLREVSLDELSKSTRISLRFLEALESEDWERLPGGIFGHGFVRAIARYLGLDEEALLSEYDLARADKLPPPPAKPEERIPSPPKWIPAAAVLIGLLLLLLLFYGMRYAWHRLAAYRAARRSAAVMAAPADQPLELTVSASATTHLRVIADDKVLMDSELYAGETLHFIAKRQFDVSATNSSAVLLQMNGRPMPPLSSPGTFGRMVFSHKDLRQASSGDSQR